MTLAHGGQSLAGAPHAEPRSVRAAAFAPKAEYALAEIGPAAHQWLGALALERAARKRWRLGSLLRAVVGGMLVGSKSLAEVETLSTRLSRRSVTQRSDERRATPWKTLMSDCFFALITTTAAELLRPPRAVC